MSIKHHNIFDNPSASKTYSKNTKILTRADVQWSSLQILLCSNTHKLFHKDTEVHRKNEKPESKNWPKNSKSDVIGESNKVSHNINYAILQLRDCLSDKIFFFVLLPLVK